MSMAQLESHSDSGEPDDLWRYLADAHCHPQEDPPTMMDAIKTRASALAVMATRQDDWDDVAALGDGDPRRVIPCFGVHPWHAHSHAFPQAGGAGPCVGAVLEERKAGAMEASQDLLRTLPSPSTSWLERLPALLEAHPSAIIGECGIDKAATIPGSNRGLATSWEHQLALMQAQIAVAARAGRPVSLHCVRGYGAMQDTFRALPPADCPPKVMLHSFNGSPEMVGGFVKMPKVGDRFYFSFSHAINARGSPQKLVDRIRAVPDDRLLLESDQVRADAIEPGLLHICSLVSQAKGWTPEETAKRTFSNFQTFYEDQLRVMQHASVGSIRL